MDGSVDAGTPTLPRERLEVIDILRGFALLGILLVNLPIFALPLRPPSPLDVGYSYLDRVIDLAINLLARGRFFSLFSFLFGLGFALQLLRLEARGIPFGRWYTRRLLILLVIGLIHTFLIWHGDILTTYALAGFALVPFRHRSTRTLLTWSAVFLAFPLVLSIAQHGVDAYVRADPGKAAALDRALEVQDQVALERSKESIRKYSSGTWEEIMAQRLDDVMVENEPDTLLKTVPQIFGMFLLGLYAGRIRLFEEVSKYLGLIRTVWWCGLSLGLVELILTVGWMMPGRLEPPLLIEGLWGGVHQVNRTALCLFYVSSGILLFRQAGSRMIISRLAFPGRTALTNYLLQSIVCTTIFYSYGLGLYGKYRVSTGLLLTFAIFLIQVAASSLWLKRFRFGPLEWVWRSLTYGKMQKMSVETGSIQHSG